MFLSLQPTFLDHPFPFTEITSHSAQACRLLCDGYTIPFLGEVGSL